MQQVKLKNHTSRDSFDLSFRHAFSAKVGELVPCCCVEMLPGDTFNLELQHFTRTQPVNTAAYTRMREYYDWFFVPTDLLWNKFNTFVSQMTDNNQHATGINSRQVLTDMHPYFTTNQIHDHLQRLANAEHENILGYSSAETSRKLLEYLGYGKFAGSVVPNQALPFEQLFAKNLNLNPFPLLAYQKIYQDYYRNSQWENAYAPAFNLDYINGNSSSLNIPVSDINIFNGTENMFTLRYANWHKDLFMGLLPNSQFGDSASIILGDGDTSALGYLSLTTSGLAATPLENVNIGLQPGSLQLRYLNGIEAGSQVALNLSKSQVDSLKNSLGLTSSSSFSILSLRQAEALQKWKEITQSQQQDYKSQVEAHFGVSPDNGYSDRCMWIDGHVSNLDISEVTNNNITGDNPADIAGKGVGVGQGKSKFSTKIHGYLMCIYHCVPLLDYAITGVSRMNYKTMVTDYAIPEFDRTGMVSVPLVELTNSADTDNFDSDLLGYAPRYYDYKQQIDRISGLLENSSPSWTAPFTDAYIRQYLGASRSRPLLYTFFKINPSVLNPIFSLAAGDTYVSDQLLINTGFDIKAVRNLDRNGLPY